MRFLRVDMDRLTEDMLPLVDLLMLEMLLVIKFLLDCWLLEKDLQKEDRPLLLTLEGTVLIRDMSFALRRRLLVFDLDLILIDLEGICRLCRR